MPTPLPARRPAALLLSAFVLTLAGCQDPTGSGSPALQPGVYDALDWRGAGSMTTVIDAAQLTILPDGGYRFLERSHQIPSRDNTGDSFHFSGTLQYARTARETTFPVLAHRLSGHVAWVRGDTIALLVSGGLDGAHVTRFVRRTDATERARIVQLFTTGVPRVVRLVPVTRTATEMTYAPLEVDFGPRVRAAMDANGAYWSHDEITDVLRLEAPAGWEVAGTVVRPPPREERATITVRAEDATATYPLVVLRDLRAVPFQLTFGCVGPNRFAPPGAAQIDSARVLATARINFQDPGTSSWDPPPFNSLIYTGSEIRYRPGGGVDTAAVTRTVGLDHHAPDTLYTMPYTGAGTRHLVARPGRPLRYAGGALCSVEYTDFRPAEMVEVLP